MRPASRTDSLCNLGNPALQAGVKPFRAAVGPPFRPGEVFFMLLDIIVVNTGMVRQTMKPLDDNIIEPLSFGASGTSHTMDVNGCLYVIGQRNRMARPHSRGLWL